jgi:caa(3)-type oxidase subunit IV
MSDHSHTGAASHGHDDHDHDWGAHIKKYWIIFFILMGCTVLTYVAAFYIDLHSRAANVGFGLAIAAFKASLVGAIFMHMKGEKHLIYKFLVFAAYFFITMVVLILWSQSDPLPGDPLQNMQYIKES